MPNTATHVEVSIHQDNQDNTQIYMFVAYSEYAEEHFPDTDYIAGPFQIERTIGARREFRLGYEEFNFALLRIVESSLEENAQPR